MFGGGSYAMRLWLDPQRIAARNMTAGDVVAAVREQNVQVAAGVVGAAADRPRASISSFSVNAYGRLLGARSSARSSSRRATSGEITRLKDVARIELGAADYGIVGYLNNEPAVAIAIFQAPGLERAAALRPT